MLQESILLLSLVSMSLTPIKANYHAKNDKAENAIFMTSGIKAYPNKDEKNETDVYSLRFYNEKEYNGIVPIRQYGELTKMIKVGDVSFEVEHTSDVSYSETKLITTSLSTVDSVKIGSQTIFEIGEELGTNISEQYKNTFYFTNSNSTTTTIHHYVDGVNNKFGYYAMFRFSDGAYDAYCYYQHRVIANYGQMEMYQTILLDEDVDCHVKLPKDYHKTYLECVHFDTLDDYPNFCERYKLGAL